MNEVSGLSKRRAPASFFALGRRGVPAQLDVDGRAYHLVELYKHDFFAATALYATTGGPEQEPRGVARAILKVQRSEPLFGLPMAWLGRFICDHEVAIYQKLQGVAGIPGFMGRVGRTSLLHEFIPGQILHRKQKLAPEFFEQLKQLLSEVHARGVAYVDMNKRENILVGEDGRPYLIDFQISWNTFRWARHYRWAKWMLKQLQAADWYHYYKHKTQLARSTCTAEEFAMARDRSWYLRLHRSVARPMITTRRRLLSRYDLEKTR